MERKGVTYINRDELESNYLIEKLMDGGGFKHIASICSDDLCVNKTLKFLLRQYNNTLRKKENPHIDKLNNDIKNLLNEFPQVFIPKKVETYAYKNRYMIAENYCAEDYKGYSFAQKNPKNNRLSELFFIMTEILELEGELSYNNLMEKVKNKIGMMENPKTYYDESEYPSDSEDNDFESNDYTENFLEKIAYNLSITNEGDIDMDQKFYVKAVDEFFNTLTERQLTILIISVDEIVKTPENGKVPSNLEIFDNRLADLLKIKSSTYYNELIRLKGKWNFILNKYSFDEEDSNKFRITLINIIEGRLEINND